MKTALIIGGGLSGLSTAIHLIKKNITPVIIEASPKAGGRASSHFDKAFSCELDNGQHILMGCYFNALEFLHMIGASENCIYQDNLHADFVDAQGKAIPLDAGNLFYPFNTLNALLQYEAVPIFRRLHCAMFFVKCIMLGRGENPKGKTVADWLTLNGEGGEIQKALWDFLSIGALNTSPDKADAELFGNMLRQIFLRGNAAQTIILPRYDLSKTFCEPAEEYIKEHDGEILYGERLLSIEHSNGTVKAVVSNKQRYVDFSSVVLALPPQSLQNIEGLPDALRVAASGVSYSSILTLHIQIKTNNLSRPFYGLIDSPVHWVFNHGDYITTVMSNADEYLHMGDEELYGLTKGELKKYLGISSDEMGVCKIIKEKKATFVPTLEQLAKRPALTTELSNLFLAGDWAQNGLPATIEGAILNGKIAAGKID